MNIGRHTKSKDVNQEERVEDENRWLVVSLNNAKLGINFEHGEYPRRVENRGFMAVFDVIVVDCDCVC